MSVDHKVSESRKLVKQVTAAETDLVDQMNTKGLFTEMRIYNNGNN